MVLLEHTHGIQVGLIILSSVAMASYVAYNQPFSSPGLNYLSVHNEIQLLLISTWYLEFTDNYEIEYDLRYELGYVPIALSLMFLVVNITYIIVQTLSIVKLKCRHLKSKFTGGDYLTRV
jgi:hypothetical protein